MSRLNDATPGGRAPVSESRPGPRITPPGDARDECEVCPVALFTAATPATARWGADLCLQVLDPESLENLTDLTMHPRVRYG